MGLKVWLPLITDDHNQGASSAIPTSAGVTFTSTGKIGTCGYFSGASTSYIDTNYSTAIGTNDFSIALWLKLPAITSGSYFAICTSKTATAASAGFGIYWNYSQKKFLWSTADGSGGTEIWMATTVDSIVYDKWIHLVMVRDNNDSKKGFFYINGTRYELASVPVIRNITTDTKMCIGKCTNGSYPTKMYVNDFRIYDHALSTAEVREISQGLVLHYKLDSFQGGYGNPNLGNTSSTYSNQQNGVEINASGWGGDTGKVTYYHSGGYAGLPYKVYHKTATGTGGIYSKTDNDIVLEANTTYTMSIWIKASREFSDSAYNFCINRGSDNRYINYGSSFTIKTDWTYYTKTFTTPSDGAGSYGEMSIIYNDAVADYYIYFSGFKIEKGAVATPWCPPNVSLTKIQDSSGYNNNGTITGNLSLSNNTPRYQSSIYFEDYTRYISCLLNNNWIPDAITMSCWIKGTNRSARGGYHIPLNMHSTNFEISITSSSGLARMGYVVGGTRYVSDIGSNILDGNWHMLTSTFNGSTICRYIDGTLINSENRSGALTAVQTLGVGAFPGGTTYGNTQLYESDVRIYATALDADAIRQLYEVGAKVDNKGNLHTFEINEFGANQLTKTGIMKDYMVESYKTLSDGSHWQLMMYHYVDEGRNMFTSTNASYCNDFGLYSRLRDIDKFKYTDTLYEFYVIQDGLEYRWTQTNAPTTSSSPGTVTTVSGYNNPSVGLAKNGSNTYLGYNSWWGACGCWTVWQGNAIPGFGGRNCTKYLALYARISNSKFKVATQNAYAENFIEL